MTNKIILILSLSILAISQVAADCSGCENLDIACEFGPDGCVQTRAKCVTACDDDSLCWLGMKFCSKYRKCEAECQEQEDQCIDDCRSEVDHCHSKCDTVCCPRTGKCYTREPPFTADQQWHLPECSNQPRYFLYRDDIVGAMELEHGLTPEQYDPTDVTVFLVHGYGAGIYNSHWMNVTRDNLLALGGYNVILVDWRYGAGHTNYFLSASNVRGTGDDVAQMAKQLQSGLSWCIGESLGAHCCGMAGKSGAGFDRITGLDPAGPAFESDICTQYAEVCRLNKDDATLVDNIHTDGKHTLDSYGTHMPFGDIDFYPNGANRQPACPKTLIDLGCNHKLAPIYFATSLKENCFKTTHKCTDSENMPDSCTPCAEGECPNMGAVPTPPTPGLYYLTTTATPPYCDN